MMSRSLIKLALFVLPPLLLLGVAALILSVRAEPAPQPTPIPSWLNANSETRIEMTAGSATRLYNFSAPSATRIKLDSGTPGFAFAAEVRDAAGQTIASFNNKLQPIQFTLAPDTYQIAVSASDPRKAGTVSLALGSAVIAPETLDGTAHQALDCHVTNTRTTDLLVRTAPADTYAVLGFLPVDGALAALGRTDNNWVSVNYMERQGWIAGAVATLDGDCNALPVVRNPAIPDAPNDAGSFLVQVDRDGSGSFRNAISFPSGDTSDVVWVQVINLYSAPPNNYREFVLTLDCVGEGSEFVRWGSVSSPTLRCGSSIVLPFMITSAQQPLIIQLPARSRQSYVQYRLNVLPADAVG